MQAYAMSTTESEELVLAYRTPDSVEARALAAELEEADIAVKIVGDFRDVAYAGLSASGMADKELWVAGSDAGRCEEIVADWRHRRDAAVERRRVQEAVAEERRRADAEPSKPKKFQFSMRTVMIATTLAAVAWLSVFERNAERQNVYMAVIALVAAWTVTVMSFAAAWRRVVRRAHASDDDEQDADDSTRHTT